uniref:Secreted protein n=1 Tax=Parascaris univalens TaxID=6257 RepID=A0A914ZUU3_PARUN
MPLSRRISKHCDAVMLWTAVSSRVTARLHQRKHFVQTVRDTFVQKFDARRRAVRSVRPTKSINCQRFLRVASMPSCWTISFVMDEGSLPTSNSTGTLIVFVRGAPPLTSTKVDKSKTVLSCACCSGLAIAETVRIV